MSLKENDIWEENLRELQKEARQPDLQERIAKLDLVVSWYNKQWISYREYLRLFDLIF